MTCAEKFFRVIVIYKEAKNKPNKAVTFLKMGFSDENASGEN